ncbi:hypothetical protein [Streptomyces sp. NPDC050548]|uniref:hypothetical protein n=1 Tax=Streptomyces sp. NPDC050548 TaxID=3365629 RepID=UPI0037A8590F
MTMAIRRGRGGTGDGWQVSGSGNQINTGEVKGSQVQTHINGDTAASAQLQAALSKLAELNAALDTHAPQLANVGAARRAAARIDEELRSPAPDRRRLTETLETLGLAVGSVASVITIAEGLATMIAGLFT